MIDTRLFAFAALALSLAACTNDNEVTDNGPVAARINAEISDAVATRASGTQWDNGDAIGITGIGTQYDNVPYIMNGGTFKEDLPGKEVCLYLAAERLSQNGSGRNPMDRGCRKLFPHPPDRRSQPRNFFQPRIGQTQAARKRLHPDPSFPHRKPQACRDTGREQAEDRQ